MDNAPTTGGGISSHLAGSEASTSPTTPELQFLTIQEVAELARCHYETARSAAVEYHRSKGRKGLKSIQRTPRGKHLVTPTDAHRWIRGEKPARGRKAPV